MRGHIRQRGATWSVVLDDGRDAMTGKRRQRWLSGYKSQKEAERALTAALAAQDKGERIDPPAKMAYGTYLLKIWLPHLQHRVELGTLRPTTENFYRTHVETNVIPHLGSVRLRALDGGALEQLYGFLSRSGKKVRPGEPPAGLGPTTVHAVHVTIGASLRYAMRQGLLNRNVATLVDPPSPSRAQRAIWAPKEAAQFLQVTKGDRFFSLWLLAVLSGLRRGELLGLTWEALDIESHQLTVSRTIVSIRGRAIESGPKSDKSRRTIAVPAEAVEALKTTRRRQLEDRLAWGPDWVDSGLVFTQENGERLRPDAVSQAFAKAVKSAGLPHVSLHSLRHLHATTGLRAGVELLVMSKRLGHSGVGVTGNVYSHFIEELDQEAAEKTAGLLLPQAVGD